MKVKDKKVVFNCSWFINYNHRSLLLKISFSTLQQLNLDCFPNIKQFKKHSVIRHGTT